MKRQKYRETKPKKCWVGDRQKICYATREEAEAAAAVAQHDYGAPELGVYKCEFGDHWHLTAKKKEVKSEISKSFGKSRGENRSL